jgi:hypothetical protein
MDMILQAGVIFVAFHRTLTARERENVLYLWLDPRRFGLRGDNEKLRGLRTGQP